MAPPSAYAHLPVPLQHLVTAFYGVKMRAVRYGPLFRQTRRDLAASERASSEDLARLQAHELQRVVVHAATRTPYYREVFRELCLSPEAIRTPRDLCRLPVLEKATILARAQDLRASGMSSVRSYFTSGTSGTTLEVPIDDASRQRNYAFYRRALSWAGVEGGRSVTFAGRPIVPAATAHPASVWRWNPALDNRLFSSYHLSPANAPAYSRALCAYAPEYIDSYPSSVATLASLFEAAGLPAPRPRAVITSSETLTAAQRELIERVFGRCFDQYGCTEQSVFISQCEYGTYHVHPEYGILELLRPNGDPAAPGEVGEIVCTSFTNDAFPLLRYRVGDLAVPGEPGCACGRAFPVLREIVGRSDDVLITPDGRAIGRLDPVFKGRRTIHEAQIVQVSRTRIVVKIVAGPDYTDDDGTSVTGEIAARVGPDMIVTVELVQSIPRTSAGKFRAVVNQQHHSLEAETPR
jgi:phenylacetate-CoA ligase